MSYSDPYPTHPNSSESNANSKLNQSPSQMSGPGKVATPPTGTVRNPYPIVGNGAHNGQGPMRSGAPANMQHLPLEESTKSGKFGGTDLSNRPGHALYGLQYALDKAMTASKDVTHHQSGDIRHADDMSGGNPIERARLGSKVAAVSRTLDARLGSRHPMAKADDQSSAFKRAQKGAKAGRGAGDDASRRHAATQADLNSAASQR